MEMQYVLNADSISSLTASNSDIEVDINETDYKNIQTNNSDNSTKISSNINEINVQSSSRVHFGNRIICNGPLIIKQVGEENIKKCNLENLHNDQQKVVGTKNYMKLKNYGILILLGLIFFICSIFSVIIINKSSHNHNEQNQIKIVPRHEWSDYPVSVDLKRLTKTVETVKFDFANKPDCFVTDECVEILQEIQNDFKVSTLFKDIGYNFLITNDGTIYEGLGWDYRGYFSQGDNDNFITIAFINVTADNWPIESRLAGFHLMNHGVMLNKLKKKPTIDYVGSDIYDKLINQRIKHTQTDYI